MHINKKEIIKNICFTELVYGRINKKLTTIFSKQEIDAFIVNLIQETEERYFVKIGKNFYVTHMLNKIKVTINSNTFRVITVDRV